MFLESVKKHQNQKGQVLFVLVIALAVLAISAPVALNWANVNFSSIKNLKEKETAFHIAEAGVNYYRWHLAHDLTDFQDGTGEPGPYVHDVFDNLGNKIGEFSLEITPPPSGSTVVTITSTGYTLSNPQNKRKVRVRLAIPSVARFAVAANDVMRFGQGTEVFGLIHSNKGIRFDGLARNLITSSVADYDDPDHSGPNEFGVHTHVPPVDPLPPNPVPERPDVFMAGRDFPVPQIDFNGFTIDLANLKSMATSTGAYFPPSGGLGYHIILRTDDTFEVRRVVSLVSKPPFCSNNTWSIASSTPLTPQSVFPFPENGIIFVEDNLWINGQINGARLTIASAVFPEDPTTNSSITINNDLLYSAYDGSDAIGLIAQKNIQVGLRSENFLQIDGALIAKNGWIRRFYYNVSCGSEYIRDTLTLNGMLGTNQRYGFAYTDGTGYQNRIINYDANFLFAPPPSFPLITDRYSIISWEEIN